MNLSTLAGEERLFLARLEDLTRRGGPAFTPFLTERQLLIARAYIAQSGCEEHTQFHGGYSDAQRMVLGYFPHMPPDAALFPVEAVTLRYRPRDQLTHRDFLGALLSLLIKRESIGDIVPEPGRCTIFVLSQVAPVILQELTQVGRVGVRCEAGLDRELTVAQAFDDLRGTVPSLRLDCLVSLATGLSREKAVKLIQAERVSLSHQPVVKPDRAFRAGDTLSVRGYGKFIVDTIGKPTRKNRLPVDLKKYR